MIRNQNSVRRLEQRKWYERAEYELTDAIIRVLKEAKNI
jgi:dTDP-glucose pyrophosphorylase